MTLEQIEIKSKYEQLVSEHISLQRQLEQKTKEYDKSVVDDMQNLFGERKYNDQTLLLSVRASLDPKDRENALQPIKLRMQRVKKEILILKEKLKDDRTIHQALNLA